MQKLILACACLALAGCKTYPLTMSPELADAGRHPIVGPYVPKVDESGLFHLSCTDKYPNGRSAYEAFDQDRATPVSRAELARRHYLHAAMASNAYRTPDTKPVFVIPGWRLLESLQSESGLGLEVYGDGETAAASSRLVVAYRGTDFGSRKDWGNNLALYQPAQYKEAYAHLRALKTTHPAARLTATGHSLGGGIALNMSLRFDNVDAVVFNPSPRFSFGRTSKARRNTRVSLYELGEGLNGLTGAWSRLRLPNDTAYGNYNFLDYRTLSLSPVKEHGMYELARGLLLVAMTREVAHARSLFAANIDAAQASASDPVHCPSYFEQLRPVTH